jgi:hypothetical protein
VIDPTVAVKPPVVAPAATVTLAGNVALALLLDNATVSPPLGAAALKVTVQAALPGAFTLDGLHDKLVGTASAGCTTVIVPPVPEAGMAFPCASDAMTPLTVMGTLALRLPAAIVMLADATEPVGITLPV